MKKLSSVLIILFVATALFAAGTVRVGASYEVVAGRTQDLKIGETTLSNTKVSYKGSGLGFDIGGRYVVKGDFAVWADFSMSFLSDLKHKEGNGAWTSTKDKYKDYNDFAKNHNGSASKAINTISFAVGSAVNLTVDAPFEVYTGAGIFFERVLAKASMTLPTSSPEPGVTSITLKAVNLGIVGYADAAYKFSEKFGINVTVMPRIGVYNSTQKSYSVNSAVTNFKTSGFGVSISLPIVIGASYSF